MNLVNKFLKNFRENKFSRFLNYLITFISLYYVIQKFGEIEIEILKKVNLTMIISGIFLVCCSLLLQSFAWSNLFFSKNSKYLSKVWINSNIGKYFPFKIGIILNRYSKIEEASLINISKNYITEQILIISITTMFAVPLFFFEKLIFISLVFISFLGIPLILLKLKADYFKPSCFYYLSSIMNVIFLSLLTREIFGYVDFKVVSVYIFSMIIGMFIFTAPAGIGIREAVFIYFLESTLISSDILNFILISRVIYFLADVLILIFGNYYFKNEKKSNN